MKFFWRLLGGVGAFALLGAVLLAWSAFTPITLSQSPLDVQISSGSTARAVGRQVGEAGAELNPRVFELLVRLTRSAANIKAGSYELRQGVTPWQLLQKLTRGDTSQGEVALIEGWTFRQFRERINANPDLSHQTVAWTDKEILQHIGATENHPEGLFFPDTYLFDKGGSDLEVYARAYHLMQDRLQQAWQEREPRLPYTSPYQALVAASLVEKETAVAEDRPKVAAVFLNRLKRGMPLQTDPTVIYGLGRNFDGNLHKADLQGDTPYNTYRHRGLPPTPIAMPGNAALQAALHPARSSALYFVARGDGSSEFSADLESHNRAVARYQLKNRP